MRIKVNEAYFEIDNEISCFELRKKIKNEADIVILNGFHLNEDKVLRDGDNITFIKRGEIPKKDQLEALIISRHTPNVYERIKKSSVGIAGAGGLGSNIALSLARIGVSNIKVVDFDIVEPSNLNRQQYYIKDIGEYKVNALKRNLEEVNPFINIEPVIKRLNKENIKEIFNNVDIIIEAFDNPECKAELSTVVLKDMKDKVLIASSGMASYYPSNDIKTKKINDRFYICGDGINEAKEGSGLMAPRVAICANHMANCALRIILGKEGM